MTVNEYLKALESDIRTFYVRIQKNGRFMESDDVFHSMSQTSNSHSLKLESYFAENAKPEKPDPQVFSFLRARIKYNLHKEINDAPDRDEALHILMRTKEDVAGVYTSIADYYTELAEYYKNLSEVLMLISKEQIDSRNMAMDKMRSLHITSEEDFVLDNG